MTLAMVAYFAVFFATLFGGRTAAAGRCRCRRRAPLPRRARRRSVRNFTPWVVAAIVLLAIAYIPPIYSVVTGPTQPAVAYDPSSPVPLAP